jgi:hypothetical protein
MAWEQAIEQDIVVLIIYGALVEEACRLEVY